MNKLLNLLICTLFCSTALIAMDDAFTAMTSSHPNIDPKYLPGYQAQEQKNPQADYDTDTNNYHIGEHITYYIKNDQGKAVWLILNSGGNVHEQISDTDNLLTYAISCQNPEVVRLLLLHGARPTPNQFGVIDIDAFYEWVTPYGQEMLALVKTHLNPIYKPEESTNNANAIKS